MNYEHILAFDPSGNFEEGKGTTGICMFDCVNNRIEGVRNIHASAYRESSPSGIGPNGIKITDDKTFKFKFIPVAVADTCSVEATCRDCYIVNEDMFALEDGSETSEGQWLVFRYLDRSETSQMWTLYEKNGSVTIINKATGRCVDLAGGESKEGAAVFSYGINDDPTSNDNQKWMIIVSDK